ncbi:MAG: M23 family metallopeptidase [Prevotellaceae bacterium]|jgi:hypothetical protein|nr:M23 family metallopeptidase [Prevotellaceae bacterium]
MKNFCFTLLAFCLTSLSYAQNIKDVEVYSERNRQSGGIDIHAKINKYGNYSIFIEFSSLENTIHSNTYLTVASGNRKILTLSPNIENKPVNCRYSYRHIKGYTPEKIDSSFVYRLPFSTKKTNLVKASTLYNIKQRHFKDSADNNWVSWQFMLNQGDIVFAARKGRVVEIVDKYEPAADVGGVSFNSHRNSIMVEHGDGTLCSYQVIEKGSCMVSEGDIVYPGTPLAKAGTFSEKDTYQVRLHIYYPVMDKKSSKNKSIFKYVYYNPFFLTSDGVKQVEHGKSYCAISSDELVQKELTKRELKRFQQK